MPILILFIYLLLRPGIEEPSIVVSFSVCLRAYLWNRWSDLHEICCADVLWPWLGFPLAAFRYVMYFRFMNDVTFGRSGPYGEAWLAALLHRVGI